MTTSSVLEPAQTRQPTLNEPVTVPRAVRSEWIKFRSLRSTSTVLGVAVVSVLVFALVIAYNTRHLGSNLQQEDLVPSSTLQGYALAQLLVGALGVLFAAGEYSTGMIRSTLVAVPKRLPVLWAKLIVFVGIVAVSMTVMSVCGFLAAQALIGHYRTGYSLSDPGVLRVVLGTGVYLTLVGVLGVALGWIMRSVPGALVAYVSLVLVLPLLFGFFGNWGENVAKIFPGEAGGSFVRSIHQSHTLSPWTGLGVLGLWVLAAIGAAAVQLRRRDA